jgi:hypothetical protein
MIVAILQEIKLGHEYKAHSDKGIRLTDKTDTIVCFNNEDIDSKIREKYPHLRMTDTTDGSCKYYEEIPINYYNETYYDIVKKEYFILLITEL